MFEIFSRSAESSRWEIFIDSPTSRRVWLGVNMISLLSLSLFLYSRHPIRKLSISRYEILVPVTRVHPRMKYYLSFASMTGGSPPRAIYWEEEAEDLTIFKGNDIKFFKFSSRFFIFRFIMLRIRCNRRGGEIGTRIAGVFGQKLVDSRFFPAFLSASSRR